MSTYNMIAGDDLPLPVTGNEAVAPAWAFARGEHMGRDAVAVAVVDMDNPREHHISVEAEIAQATVALAIKDCKVFLARSKPTRFDTEAAISAAGFLGARRGRTMVEHLMGERGVDLSVSLAREVKARVMAQSTYAQVLIDMGHVPHGKGDFRPSPTAPTNWSKARQVDLFGMEVAA